MAVEQPDTDTILSVDLFDGSFMIGFFDHFNDFEELAKKNLWRFVRINRATDYHASNHSCEFCEMLEGKDIKSISKLCICTSDSPTDPTEG